MPLETAPAGSPGFSRNVATEVKAGKPVKQAVAIAYSKARADASSDYTTSIRQTADGDFTASVLYEGRMVPGVPMRSFATRAKAEAAVAKMLVKARGDRADASERKDADSPERHIRHKGIMIDASFNKDGTVAYYVVQGSSGRFYTLAVAKEIAEGIAARKSRKDSRSSLDAVISAVDSLFAKADAALNSGYTEILVDGDVDQTVDHNGNWQAIVKREVRDLKKMDVGRVTTRSFDNNGKKMTVRFDAAPSVSLDAVIRAADSFYAKADAVDIRR